MMMQHRKKLRRQVQLKTKLELPRHQKHQSQFHHQLYLSYQRSTSIRPRNQFINLKTSRSFMNLLKLYKLLLKHLKKVLPKQKTLSTSLKMSKNSMMHLKQQLKWLPLTSPKRKNLNSRQKLLLTVQKQLLNLKLHLVLQQQLLQHQGHNQHLLYQSYQRSTSTRPRNLFINLRTSRSSMKLPTPLLRLPRPRKRIQNQSKDQQPRVSRLNFSRLKLQRRTMLPKLILRRLWLPQRRSLWINILLIVTVMPRIVKSLLELEELKQLNPWKLKHSKKGKKLILWSTIL